MQTPNIKTTKNVVPMIYAYTTPEIRRHDGWTKIGYTEQDVETRIKQQTHTADVKWHLEWQGNALFEDGTGDRFTDKEFHAYLRNFKIDQEPGKNNEWFHINGPESRLKFYDFKMDRGILKTLGEVVPYHLRKEQEEAVSMTLEYRKNHPKEEFLWNAKPRFGKTLATYDFCKKSGAKKVLIVTNRPAIANSWFDDYKKFLGPKSGYFFVSEVSALKDKTGVLSREKYMDCFLADEEKYEKCIEFVSLQDMKGSSYFSANGIEKLSEVAGTQWDILIIDEAHEGVDTYKTDVAFDRIQRDFTLHLSGTPFKALANNKFADDAIYNWTYADEQTAKRDWDVSSEEENPYETLPQLNLYTYQMSEIIQEELKQGVEINGETEEYAFDLNEFFSTNNGKFKYDSSVDKFLDALTLQKKFPFSTPELREELKHTFWLMDRVESAKAMASKLENHPIFKDYTIILAAGDGRLNDDDEIKKSYDKVVEAIQKNDSKTITLSVGQLTTGVTIPEWTAVLMLSNVKSPALYMQAAFRAQNPCMFQNGSIYTRKENAYVFDFDPARTLTIFEKFANDLSANTSNGGGDSETRKENIRELLNFFPVIGEDEKGELVELDAEKVLSIPRKIRSVEVVRRGFMSNFLFRNISQVFGAPQAVIDIISSFEAVDKKMGQVSVSSETKEELSLNEKGEVELSEEIIIGRTRDVFGDKISAPVEEIVEIVANASEGTKDLASTLKKVKSDVHAQVKENILAEGKNAYGSEMSSHLQKNLERSLVAKSDRLIDKSQENYEIEKNIIEEERKKALQSRHETGKSTEEINQEYDQRNKENEDKFLQTMSSGLKNFFDESKQEVVETMETNRREKEKNAIEGDIRDHLRGFSRTIPSFLMAYGDETVTLETFDTVIPDDVFQEVTSISLEQFRFLRDGGDYPDPETGEKKHFDGQLFEPEVFNASVEEFLVQKKRLANYFAEENEEDIFDYIPPQKTNQIFTPKSIVKKMVDMLEEENPGCFDSPDRTFIDLYMKSGLYITEIVKRLYQSEKMKELFPDKKERLQHIFTKQVYGLAPTEIIYRIATNYILGFDDDIKDTEHNFKQVDALPYAKAGTLQEKLDELYG